MLYCDYCNYLRESCNTEDLKSCRNFMCEFAKCVLSVENIYELTEYPCTQCNNQ